MKQLLTCREMAECDRYTMEDVGLLSPVLMERAALSVADEIEQKCISFRYRTIRVVCGSGNNGGDGIAIGRILFLKGYSVTVIMAGNIENCSIECRRQMEIARKYQMEIQTEPDYTPVDILIDAIFGIGLNRTLSPYYAEYIASLNKTDAKWRIAVDIPSGVNGNSGEIYQTAFHADTTITFAYGKPGLFLYPALEYVGEIRIKDIGIYLSPNVHSDIWLLEDVDRQFFPNRLRYSNKGTYGKILIIAGSKSMAGAAIFAARAAYASGAGLVKVATPEENRIIIQTSIPEAMLVTYQGTDFSEVTEAMNWADTIAIGPGIGRTEASVTLLQTVFSHCSKPIVVDADAISILSEHDTICFPEDCIITPHIGEMARFCHCRISDIQQDPLHVALQIAKEYNITVVLKDTRTVIASSDGRIRLHTAGNDGMATGGSGDVLTGVIAGWRARIANSFDAASFSVLAHGLAGDQAALQVGKDSMTASHLLNGLQTVLKEGIQDETI